MKFDAAIEELKKSLYTARTNEPINRKMHNVLQANLEKRNAADFEDAIKTLKRKDLWKHVADKLKRS